MTCGGDDVIEFVDRKREVRERYSLGQYFFTISVHQIREYIFKDNLHGPTKGERGLFKGCY